VTVDLDFEKKHKAVNLYEIYLLLFSFSSE